MVQLRVLQGTQLMGGCSGKLKTSLSNTLRLNSLFDFYNLACGHRLNRNGMNTKKQAAQMAESAKQLRAVVEQRIRANNVGLAKEL